MRGGAVEVHGAPTPAPLSQPHVGLPPQPVFLSQPLPQLRLRLFSAPLDTPLLPPTFSTPWSTGHVPELCWERSWRTGKDICLLLVETEVTSTCIGMFSKRRLPDGTKENEAGQGQA